MARTVRRSPAALLLSLATAIREFITSESSLTSDEWPRGDDEQIPPVIPRIGGDADDDDSRRMGCSNGFSSHPRKVWSPGSETEVDTVRDTRTRFFSFLFIFLFLGRGGGSVRDAVLIFVFCFLSFFKALIFSLSLLLSNLFFFLSLPFPSAYLAWSGFDHLQTNKWNGERYLHWPDL